MKMMQQDSKYAEAQPQLADNLGLGDAQAEILDYLQVRNQFVNPAAL